MHDMTNLLSGLLGTDRVNDLQDLSDVAYFTKNSNLQYLSVSAAFAKLFNLKSTDDIIGKTDSDLLSDPKIAEEHHKSDLEVLNGRTIKGLILGGNKDDSGRTQYFYINKRARIDKDTNETFIVGTVSDYTIKQTAKLRMDKQISRLNSLPDDMLAFMYLDITDWVVLSGSYKIDGNTISITEKTDISDVYSQTHFSGIEDFSYEDFILYFNKENLMRQYFLGMPGDKYEHISSLSDGSFVFYSFEHIFVTNPYSDHICLYLLVYDKSNIFSKRRDIILAAEHDSLTGVLNRKTAFSQIESYCNTYGKGTLHALLIIDADNFKAVNDSFGHIKGDEVLKALSAKLISFFYDTDVVGRLGGDEFIVLMKNVRSADDVKKKITQLLEAVQYAITNDEQSFLVTMCVGVTLFVGGDKTVEALYSESDKALYAAKKISANSLCFSNSTPTTAIESQADSQESTESFNLLEIIRSMSGVLSIVDISESDYDIVFNSSVSYSGEFLEECLLQLKDPFLQKYRASINIADTFEFVLKYYPSSEDESFEWLRFTGSCIGNTDGVRRNILMVSRLSSSDESTTMTEVIQTKQELVLSLFPVVSWEYDVNRHMIATSGIARSIFAPSTVSDSFDTFDFFVPGTIAPSYEDDYKKLYSDIDAGSESGVAQIEFLSFFGMSGLAKVSYKTIFDAKGAPIVATFAASEVALTYSASSDYANLLKDFENSFEKNQTCFRFDLTTNEVISASYSKDSYFDTSLFESVNEFLSFVVSKSDSNDEHKRIISKQASREFFTHAYNNGIHTIKDEGYFYVTNDYSEWFSTVVYLVANPSTERLEAFIHIDNNNSEHATKAITDSLIQNQCDAMLLINTNSKHIHLVYLKPSYYRFKLLLNKDNDYDAFVKAAISTLVVEDEITSCTEMLDYNLILDNLEHTGIYSEYVSIFDKALELRRKQLTFKYLNADKKKLSCVIMDATNQSNLEYIQPTGLFNSVTFYRTTRKIMLSHKDTRFVLIRWDIDDFKVYNDLYGIKAGDEVLLTIANALRSIISDTTNVGSLGGDIFLICMPAHEFVPEKFSSWLSDTVSDFIKDYTFTFHMAACVIESNTDDITAISDKTLIALKTIKNSMERRFVWYDESMRESYLAEQAMLADIRKASPDDFVIFVQPQYNQLTDTLVSGEVLVRWKHPQKGFISPGVFIPVMEKAHLISWLDAIVWEKTCAFLRRRLDAGQSVVPLSVNVSVQDFYQPNFIKILSNLLTKYNLEPKYINLEVTESIVIKDLDFIISLLAILRNRGFTIELDDFGSGFSSLNVLKTVPCDIIKLDLRFFQIQTDGSSLKDASEKASVIISSVVRMAHRLNLPVIAEGVETSKQADFLRSIDCSLVQGFFFSKPLALADFEKHLNVKAHLKQRLWNRSSTQNYLDSEKIWYPDSISFMLFNTFTGPAGVFEVDDFNIHAIRVNDSFLKEINFPTEDIRWSIYNFYQSVFPADIPILRDAFNEAESTGQKLDVECRFLTYLNKGHTQRLKLTIRKETSTSKSFRYYFVTVSRVTSKLSVEEKLYSLVERAADLLSSAPVGCIIYDLSIDGKLHFHYENDRFLEMGGYSKHSFDKNFSKNGFLAIAEKDRKDLGKLILSYLKNRSHASFFSVECHLVCADGSLKPVIISGSAPDMNAPLGPLVGTIFLVDDTAAKDYKK